MRACVLALVLAGCYRPSDPRSCQITCTTVCPGTLECVSGKCVADGEDCSTQPDGGTQDVADADITPRCFGRQQAGYMYLCFPANEVSGTVTVTAIDTSVDAACSKIVMPQEQGAPEVCAILGGDLVVPAGSTVAAVGTRPLLLLGAERVVIDGTLDVAGHVGSPREPAGSPGSICAAPNTLAGTTTSAGGGGGAGGSFRGLGGNGGAGNNGALAVGGTASDEIEKTFVRGGCPGGIGGNANGLGGAGGWGGGGVYLMTGGTLVVSGVVNASGGGGKAPGAQAGGGGGGSGGVIILDAMTNDIRSGARIFALGGGGASGANAMAGNNGDEPMGGAPSKAVMGPTGAGTGGAGGGTSDVCLGQAGTNGGGGFGGGGGGGACGWIRSPVAITAPGAIINPVPVP